MPQLATTGMQMAPTTLAMLQQMQYLQQPDAATAAMHMHQAQHLHQQQKRRHSSSSSTSSDQDARASKKHRSKKAKKAADKKKKKHSSTKTSKKKKKKTKVVVTDSSEMGSDEKSSGDLSSEKDEKTDRISSSYRFLGGTEKHGKRHVLPRIVRIGLMRKVDADFYI